MKKNPLTNTATYKFLHATYGDQLSNTARAMIAEDFLRENAEAETPGYVFNVDRFDEDFYEYAREGALYFLADPRESTIRVNLTARGYLRPYKLEEEAKEAGKQRGYEVAETFEFNECWWAVDVHQVALDFQEKIINHLAANSVAHTIAMKPWFIPSWFDTGFVGADKKRYSSFWAVN